MNGDDELQFLLDEETRFMPVVGKHNGDRMGALNPVAQQLAENARSRSFSGDALVGSYGSSYNSLTDVQMMGDTTNAVQPVETTFNRNVSGRTNPVGIVMKESNKRRRSSDQNEMMYNQIYSGTSPQRTKSIKIGTSPNRWGYGTPPGMGAWGSSEHSSTVSSSGKAAPVEFWEHKNPKLVLKSYNCMSPGVAMGAEQSNEPSKLLVGSIDSEFVDFYQEGPLQTIERSDTVPFEFHTAAHAKEVTAVCPRPQQLQSRFQSNLSSCEPLRKGITEMEIQ